MNEEVLRIQKMVAEGKITPEESVELLESVLGAAAVNRPGPAAAGGREPTVKSAFGTGLDAVAGWPVSKGLLVVCCVALGVIVVILTHGEALLPLAAALAGFIGAYLMVYLWWRRRSRERAAEQGGGMPGAVGSATGAGAAPAAQVRPAGRGFGIAGLAFLALSLLLLPVLLLFVMRASPTSSQGGTVAGWMLIVKVSLGLLVVLAIILGFLGWRSIPGKIAAIGGLVAAVAAALALCA